MGDELKISCRNLPHWELEGSIYFITFRLAHGELSPGERTLAFAHVRSGDGKFYTLYACVVMPDHAHLIVKPNAGVELQRMMKGIKGVSARVINEARGARGTLWQDESFDRILRDQTEFIEKCNYVLNNPVKRGLVERAEEYRWLFVVD